MPTHVAPELVLPTDGPHCCGVGPVLAAPCFPGGSSLAAALLLRCFHLLACSSRHESGDVRVHEGLARVHVRVSDLPLRAFCVLH